MDSNETNEHGIREGGRLAADNREPVPTPDAKTTGLRFWSFFFFWTSLSVFLFTCIAVTFAYCEVRSWPTGGEPGFVVLFAMLVVNVFAVGGVGLSLALCGLSIPYYKCAIALLVVELIPFLYLLTMLFGFVTGVWLFPVPP